VQRDEFTAEVSQPAKQLPTARQRQAREVDLQECAIALAERGTAERCIRIAENLLRCYLSGVTTGPRREKSERVPQPLDETPIEVVASRLV
jgi:hypothetical protein